MKGMFLQKLLIASAFLVGAGYLNQAAAHSAGATLDPAGNNPAATDLAMVNCYDDTGIGAAPPHHLEISIQDLSPPVSGLYVSAEIYANNQMTNVTDNGSGDGVDSRPVSLAAGEGPYYLSVSKTNYGKRTFNLTYHCKTANDVHTGTDISVFQAQ